MGRALDRWVCGRGTPRMVVVAVVVVSVVVVVAAAVVVVVPAMMVIIRRMAGVARILKGGPVKSLRRRLRWLPCRVLLGAGGGEGSGREWGAVRTRPS